MAHECPECGQVCHCNGDIDDIVFDDDKAEGNCICCVCSRCGRTPDYCTCYQDEITEVGYD